MIRTLLIITGASVVLCAAALGGAVALGGNDLARNGWTWTFRDEDGDRVRVERVKQDIGPEVTRTLPWTGGGMLHIDLPGEVTFVQGDAKTVTITGPEALAERVHLLQGNRLTFNDGDDTEEILVHWGRRGFRAHQQNLKITVTAPDVRIFNLSSSADLLVRDYDQNLLALVMSGSGNARVQGQAEVARLNLSGSGDADLSSLDLRDAQIDIDGSGDVDLAATGDIEVEISGSGDVNLHRRPRSLKQTLSGSGSVSQD